MTKISDLNNLNTGPNNIDEWLDNFTPEDRATVEQAILNHRQADVWPVLANLDENPYPFSPKSLGAWRSKQKGRA